MARAAMVALMVLELSSSWTRIGTRRCCTVSKESLMEVIPPGALSWTKQEIFSAPHCHTDTRRGHATNHPLTSQDAEPFLRSTLRESSPCSSLSIFSTGTAAAG